MSDGGIQVVRQGNPYCATAIRQREPSRIVERQFVASLESHLDLAPIRGKIPH